MLTKLRKIALIAKRLKLVILLINCNLMLLLRTNLNNLTYFFPQSLLINPRCDVLISFHISIDRLYNCNCRCKRNCICMRKCNFDYVCSCERKCNYTMVAKHWISTGGHSPVDIIRIIIKTFGRTTPMTTLVP